MRFPTTAVCLVLLGLTLVCDGRPAWADGQPMTVASLADGKPIAITYYPVDEKAEGEPEDAPVVILIHGTQKDRLFWEKAPTNLGEPTAVLLSRAGFAVVTIDMRGYGESRAAAGRRVNPQAYYGDLEAVKKFLLDEHQQKRLNINKIGVVAAGDFSAIAATWAAGDWRKPDYDDAIRPSERTPRGRDVQAVALLSPSLSMSREKTAPAIRYLADPARGVSLLVLSGEDDPRDKGAFDDLSRLMNADKEPTDNLYAIRYKTAFHGTDLLGQRNLPTERDLFAFLTKYLKEVESPWVDRRSRLER